MVGVQRRGCHLGVEGGAPLILSALEVPLAPNALAVDVRSYEMLESRGVRAGHVVALGLDGTGDDAPDQDADWLVALGTATTWEPRPRVHRLVAHDVVERVRTTRATVVAEGAVASLLPLLWPPEADVQRFGLEFARIARTAAQRLRDAAVRGDEASLMRAAHGLAGLGPGLTPSGDDFLAGFAAAWILVGDALDLDGVARRRVTDAVFMGAAGGASALGLAWLGHALRGELLEPMTRFVEAFLDVEVRDLGAAARGALMVGTSSGTDWMVGFLLAATTLLDATPSRQPW